MLKKTLYVLSLSLTLFLSDYVQGQQPAVQTINAPQKQDLDASAAAANSWLQLVDQGKYGESWDAGSLTFQLTISRNEWMKALDLARRPLGSVNSRELLRQDPAQNPKDLPKGDYIVVYYKTSFANKPNAHERVILQKQNNGQWKMLTYDFS